MVFMKSEKQIRERLADYLTEMDKCSQLDEMEDYVKWGTYANILLWVLNELELPLDRKNH